jgi:hypothetical protein
MREAVLAETDQLQREDHGQLHFALRRLQLRRSAGLYLEPEEGQTLPLHRDHLKM